LGESRSRDGTDNDKQQKFKFHKEVMWFLQFRQPIPRHTPIPLKNFLKEL
jgi:hypothetical protein